MTSLSLRAIAAARRGNLADPGQASFADNPSAPISGDQGAGHSTRLRSKIA